MLNDNKQYFYQDCYMYFTFAGVYSKRYNLFITNSKGFTKVNTVGGSVKTETPDYQNMNYYLGTAKSKKTFKIDVACEGLSYEQYKEMMDWLEEGKTGFLYFDSDVDWGWDVVISKIGDATQNFTYHGGVYEFNIQFDTIGTYYARSPWDLWVDVKNVFTSTAVNGDRTAAEKTIANKYGVPEIVVTSTASGYKDIYLPSVSNRSGYIDYIQDSSGPGRINLIIDKQTNFAATSDSDKYISYIKYVGTSSLDATSLKYLGASNYIIVNDSSIIEGEEKIVLTASYQNNGLMTVNGYTPIARDNYTIGSQNVTELQLYQEDLNIIQYWNNLYICIAWPDRTNTNTYGQELYNNGAYPYKFYSCIWFDPQISGGIVYLPKVSWNRNLTPSTKPIVVFGRYDKLRLNNNIADQNCEMIVHKYNNM